MMWRVTDMMEGFSPLCGEENYTTEAFPDPCVSVCKVTEGGYIFTDI